MSMITMLFNFRLYNHGIIKVFKVSQIFTLYKHGVQINHSKFYFVFSVSHV